MIIQGGGLGLLLIADCTHDLEASTPARTPYSPPRAPARPRPSPPRAPFRTDPPLLAPSARPAPRPAPRSLLAARAVGVQEDDDDAADDWR